MYAAHPYPHAVSEVHPRRKNRLCISMGKILVYLDAPKDAFAYNVGLLLSLIAHNIRPIIRQTIFFAFNLKLELRRFSFQKFFVFKILHRI